MDPFGMASDSACAKLNDRFHLLSRFHLPSPPRPAAACKSRIKFIRIKPRPLAAAVLPKPLPASSSFSVNDNEVHVQEVVFPKNHVSLLVVGCSLIMFVYNPPSASALSASSTDLVYRIAKPLSSVFTVVAGSMLVASFKFEAIRHLLFLSGTSLLALPWVAITVALIGKSHEFIDSVIKLQVGLSGSGSSRVQMNLTHTAKVADTSTGKGLRYVLAETALNLLQNIDFCNSAYSSVDVKVNSDKWKSRFKQLSVEERCKFDEEALVNMNSIWTSSSANTRSTKFRDENIVVTILIAVKGVHKLPPINGTSYLKEALQKIASIPAEHTLAVEVFWTPQNENDVQWEQKFLKDYPSLKQL